jgi:hypothetical protein
VIPDGSCVVYTGADARYSLLLTAELPFLLGLLLVTDTHRGALGHGHREDSHHKGSCAIALACLNIISLLMQAAA